MVAACGGGAASQEGGEVWRQDLAMGGKVGSVPFRTYRGHEHEIMKSSMPNILKVFQNLGPKYCVKTMTKYF